ncbi:MAG: CBS domain-containing protein [Proteobacteria bacterium]|nr:CBS domain-containing protein [Pseudomonadota bacterium]
MVHNSDVFTAQASELVPFLKKTLPFSELPAADLAALASQCSIDFYLKGTRLLTQNETIIEDVLIVRSGAVKLTLIQDQGEEKPIDYRGEGQVVGALGAIRNAPASLSAETIEDTFCFKVPAEVFRKLVLAHPTMAQFYLHSFSESYISKAFSELRRQHANLCATSPLYLFASRVGDIVKTAPVMIASGRTIREAAQIMNNQNIGSLLVTDPSGEATGIVTDKDLRRAVAEGEAYDAPVEFIMSSPLATVPHREPCFDALLKMMSSQIHHLAVTRHGEVQGMITSHDIMLIQGRSPVSLFREIMAVRDIPGLYPLSQKVPFTVGGLIEEGAKAGNITRMITVMNDLILEKLLNMLQDEMGPPPVPFCWILMGSEGRKEQTFHTDQDNALVYRDPVGEDEARAAKDYFKHFTEAAIEHLVQCGYPLCPGEMMASNPKWRQPFSVCRDYFERMILRPEPAEVLNATIFFDFRPGYGQLSLGQSLRSHVTVHAARETVFLHHLAKDCLTARPPLSFFRGFIVEKNGEHKDRLDLKKSGLVPFVDFGRLFALRHKIIETNTLDRFEILKERGHVAQNLISEAVEAYEFLMQLRLVHQMTQINNGQQPDNHVNPSDLSDLEKQTLKEAFGVIGGMQSFIKDVFHLNIG